MKRFFRITGSVLIFLNAIILLGTVIDMLKEWIGVAAYLVGIFVAVILSPVIIVLPWFESWVSGEPVNANGLMLWGAMVACIVLNLALSLGERRGQGSR